MVTKNAREKIIRTAIDAFYRRGYADTPIREIGTKAGVSTALLYHHFKNKEEILFEIIQRADRDLINNLKEIEDKHSNPFECLREMLIAHTVHFSITRKKESKILVEELNQLKGKRNEIIKRSQREIYKIYKKKLKDLQAIGMLNDLDLTVLNFSVFGVINGFFRWFKMGGRLKKEEVAEEIVKFVFYGMIKSKSLDTP